MKMTALQQLTQPNSLTLPLKTLTPIYTGGIGQYGEQIHPSGILGNIRHFSCLLAAAIGDSSFETRVWGASEDENHHAKRVALHINTNGLTRRELPAQITWQENKHQHKGWFYNIAQEGKFSLTLTRRGITDDDWRLLLLALRIQIRHATLGAKDQFGLGVVTTDQLPNVAPWKTANAPLSNTPSLHNAFFAKLRFSCPSPNSLRECLEAGLRVRAYLRNSFRHHINDTALRHYLFGELNQWGSAINVSAVYPLNDDSCELRIWGVLPHTTCNTMYNQVIAARATLLTRLQTALKSVPSPHWNEHCKINVVWKSNNTTNLVTWINKLAGISQ